MANIKQFIFNKLFFSKLVVIDQPGIIYNILARKYGRAKNKKRIVFIFEDIFAEMQKETIAQLGPKKASELFYKIGKDFGVSYMLLGGAKKVSNFLLPEVIRFITNNFKYSGFSITNKVDIKDGVVTVSGKDNLICRRTGDCSFIAGTAAGIISILSGKNLGGFPKCGSCPQSCKLIVKEDKSSQYIPDMDNSMLDKRYEQLNFPQDGNPSDHLESFAKLMQFKKINISESGKYELDIYPLFPTPPQLMFIALSHFEEIGRQDILEKAIFRSTAKIINHLTMDCPTVRDKVRVVNALILSLGWGIPNYQKKGNLIKYHIQYPPFNKFGFSYQALQLNAFLSPIFNKRLKLEEIKSQENPPLLKLTYSL